MLMQNFGMTNKEHYGMLWYFLEWSITLQMERLTDLLSSYKQITGIVMQAAKRVQLNVALESVNTTR